MADIDTLIHDTRNPLNAISVNAELAKLLAQREGSKERLVQSLDLILQECRKCSEILERFRENHDD